MSLLSNGWVALIGPEISASSAKLLCFNNIVFTHSQWDMFENDMLEQNKILQNKLHGFLFCSKTQSCVKHPETCIKYSHVWPYSAYFVSWC